MTTEKPKTPRKAPAKPRAAKVKDKLAPMIAEAPSAEEAEVRRTRLKTLIALGKERGYLTYAEINDHLPDDLVDAEQIESIISTFNDMGIQVFDVAPAAEDLLMSEVAPTVVDDEQAEAEAEPSGKRRRGIEPIKPSQRGKTIGCSMSPVFWPPCRRCSMHRQITKSAGLAR